MKNLKNMLVLAIDLNIRCNLMCTKVLKKINFLILEINCFSVGLSCLKFLWFLNKLQICKRKVNLICLKHKVLFKKSSFYNIDNIGNFYVYECSSVFKKKICRLVCFYCQWLHALIRLFYSTLVFLFFVNWRMTDVNNV